MKAKYICLWIILYVVISACDGFVDDYVDRTFLPGESLCSNDLEFRKQSFVENKRLLLLFKMDNKVIYESQIKPGLSRYAPTEDVFAAFGEEASKVKSEYENAYQTRIRQVSRGGSINSTSVLYSSGISLVADKRFLGVEPGMNIASEDLLKKIDGALPVAWFGDYFTTAMADYYCLDYYFGLEFEDTGFTKNEEVVTFHLEMPVKVGLFLTMLRDRVSTPDAEMQYRDEVLVCDFTLPYCLQ